MSVGVSQGVKIYDISTKQRITNVLRDNVSLRPDMYPCSLCWKDNTTLIVGWGTSIKVCFFSFLYQLLHAPAPAVYQHHCFLFFFPQICVVKERNPTEMRDLPSRYVEIGTNYTEHYTYDKYNF